MAALFENLLKVGDAIVDKVMAESLSLVPMRAIPNGRPVADNSRAAVTEFKGIFDNVGVLLDMAANGPGNLDRVSSGPQVSYIETSLPYAPRRPDRITRTKTGITYQVRSVTPDVMGRIVAMLEELGP